MRPSLAVLLVPPCLAFTPSGMRSSGEAIGSSWQGFESALDPPSRAVTRDVDVDSIFFDGHEASLSHSLRPTSWTVNPHLEHGAHLALSSPLEESTSLNRAVHNHPSLPTPSLNKDMQISLLVAFYNTHGDWPSINYHDPQTGAALGLLLDRIIERQVALTEQQREALLDVDPDVFGVGYQIHRAALKARHVPWMSKDEKINRLITYYKQHHSWPTGSYKDPHTGVALGSFLRDVVEENVSLTGAQRALLYAQDSQVFRVMGREGGTKQLGGGNTLYGGTAESDAMDMLLNSVIRNLV